MSDFMIKNGNTYVQPLQRYVADSEADKDNIGLLGVPIGSTCYVIDTKKNYMLDSTGEWTEVESGGGDSSLPEVSSIDNGKVLTVVDGEWDKAEPQSEDGYIVNFSVIFSAPSTISGMECNKTYSELDTYLTEHSREINLMTPYASEVGAIIKVQATLDDYQYKPQTYLMYKLRNSYIVFMPYGFNSFFISREAYASEGFSGEMPWYSIAYAIKPDGSLLCNFSMSVLNEDGNIGYGTW